MILPKLTPDSFSQPSHSMPGVRFRRISTFHCGTLRTGKNIPRQIAAPTPARRSITPGISMCHPSSTPPSLLSNAPDTPCPLQYPLPQIHRGSEKFEDQKRTSSAPSDHSMHPNENHFLYLWDVCVRGWDPSRTTCRPPSVLYPASETRGPVLRLDVSVCDPGGGGVASVGMELQQRDHEG